MPDMPKFLIIRPLENSEKMSAEDQKVFQSRYGMLLYLIKHSRSFIVDMTQELSKVNDCANPSLFCELLHVIRYVFDTKIVACIGRCK